MYKNPHLVDFMFLFRFWRFRVRWGPFLFWFPFCVLCVVLLLLHFIVLFVGVFLFWKVLGEVRPEGPPHLTLNLPGFLVCLVCFVDFCFCSGRFRVRPPHLTLNLPCLFVCVFPHLFCGLCFFCFILLLWVGLCLLFGFCLWTPQRFSLQFWCSGGVTLVQNMFSNSGFGSWFLLCFLVLVSWEVEMLSVLSFWSKETQWTLCMFWDLALLVHLLDCCFGFDFSWFVFPYPKTNPQTWKTKQ